MFRSFLAAASLLASLLAACNGGEEAPPPGSVGGTAPPTSIDRSSILTWRQGPYLLTAYLSADAIVEGELERLGQAELSPRRVSIEVFRWREKNPWELLSPDTEGWLAWEPLAVVEARRHLAGRRDLAMEQIRVLSVDEVEWPDSCLGLPEPGEVCAEVITPGFRIELAALREDVITILEYRSDRAGHLRAAP